MGLLPNTGRVAVVGDYMLDVYVDGSVRRVCPDAPAAVLDAERELCAAGGAANVAVGCSAHGLEVVACGLSGRDRPARSLETLLAEAGVRLDGLVSSPSRTTLVKRRFRAANSVLLRVDEGSTEAATSRQVARMASVVDAVDAVLVSDYGYGVVAEPLMEAVAERRAAHPFRLLVDSKTPGAFTWLRPDVVKPNYRQALELLDEEPEQDRVQHITRLAPQLLETTGADFVAVTLDRDGCVAIDGQGAVHLPAPNVEVRATSGAGDSFLVAMAAALLEGAAPREAAAFATRAATAACRGEATASVRVPEDEPAPHRGKQIAPEQVREWCGARQAEGKRVALTNGCFDIFHAGHAEFLHRAAAAGDVLLVAVNSDDSVRRLKGDGRPVNALPDRLRVLEAIGVVSAVTWFDESTAAEVVALTRPDAYVKGADYRGLTFPEAEFVRRYGGEVVFVDLLEGRSTTDIVKRVRARSKEVAV